MHHAITTTDPAPGLHDLAARALSLHRSTTETAIAVLGDAAPAAIAAGLAKLEHDLRPVPEGAARKAWVGAIDERLRRLAAKAAPGMAQAPADAWRDSTIEALSDLPAMVALTACKRAIHVPFQFLNQIEPVVRDIAADIAADREARRKALMRLRAEIDRAARPRSALPAAAIEERPITAAQIRAMSPTLRAAGLKIGAITQGEVDAAMMKDTEDGA